VGKQYQYALKEKGSTGRGLAIQHKLADKLVLSKVRAFYKQRIDSRSEELANYERVKAFTLLPEPFTQETGELTPTQKIKRKVVRDKYAAQIEAMYPKD